MLALLSLRKMSAIVLLLLLLLISPLRIFAQADAGSISGTIRDTSGAVLGGANLRLTNEATGQASTSIIAPCARSPLGTPVGYAREPFAGNVLPANRLDPNAIKLLNWFPSPTNSSLFNNYSSNLISQATVDQGDVRIDHTFTEKDGAFGRISYPDTPSSFQGRLPGSRRPAIGFRRNSK